MKNEEWEHNLEIFDRLVSVVPGIERKWKTNPYTSVNGHMFTLLNKDGELGFRFSETEAKSTIMC